MSESDTRPTTLVRPMKVLFLHGWTSTPGGVKPTYLENQGHEVLNPALPDEDFEAAARHSSGPPNGRTLARKHYNVWWQ